MRDSGRIREKIEIVLDSRQVVSLVLGSAVALGIVFYLGVTVGKDLAAAAAPEPTDALARLDEQAAAEQLDEKLTFPEALTEEEIPAFVRPPAAAKPAATKPEVAKPEVAKPDPAQPASEKPASAAAAPAAPPKPAAAPASERPAPKAEPEGPRFTVQVGAMPTEPEAEALVARLRARGLSPYVVRSEVPGKGVFFRVRIGRFASREEAKRYLDDLQRESALPGFVAQVD